MDTFTTGNGLVLPLLNLKGKLYLQVAHRVQWFRSEYPFGRIDTECLERNEKYVIYKASISIPYGNNQFSKLADGVKREDFQHFYDADEKSQTGAIGRALALCGFGTQFAIEELDEGERLADTPVAVKKPSHEPIREFKDELPNGIKPNKALYQFKTGKHTGKTFAKVAAEDPTYINFLKKIEKPYGDQKDFLEFYKALEEGQAVSKDKSGPPI